MTGGVESGKRLSVTASRLKVCSSSKNLLFVEQDVVFTHGRRPDSCLLLTVGSFQLLPVSPRVWRFGQSRIRLHTRLVHDINFVLSGIQRDNLIHTQIRSILYHSILLFPVTHHLLQLLLRLLEIWQSIVQLDGGFRRVNLSRWHLSWPFPLVLGLTPHMVLQRTLSCRLQQTYPLGPIRNKVLDPLSPKLVLHKALTVNRRFCLMDFLE